MIDKGKSLNRLLSSQEILNGSCHNIDVPAQLDSLARFDPRQIGPGLIWLGSNWVKESQYGLDHKTKEQNEFYDSN